MHDATPDTFLLYDSQKTSCLILYVAVSSLKMNQMFGKKND